MARNNEETSEKAWIEIERGGGGGEMTGRRSREKVERWRQPTRNGLVVYRIKAISGTTILPVCHLTDYLRGHSKAFRFPACQITRNFKAPFTRPFIMVSVPCRVISAACRFECHMVGQTREVNIIPRDIHSLYIFILFKIITNVIILDPMFSFFFNFD